MITAAVCLVIAIVAFLFMVVASADPEGRGGSYALAGFVVAAVFLVAFVVLSVRWFLHYLH